MKENFKKLRLYIRPWALFAPVFLFAVLAFRSDFYRDLGFSIPIGVLATAPAFIFWRAFQQFNRSEFGPAVGSLLFLAFAVFAVVLCAGIADDARKEKWNDEPIWLGTILGIAMGIFIPRKILYSPEGNAGKEGPLFHASAIDEILGQAPQKILPDGTRVYSTPLLDGRIRITSVSPSGKVTYAKAFPSN